MTVDLSRLTLYYFEMLKYILQYEIAISKLTSL